MSDRIETRCIHGDLDFSYREATRAVSFPIFQTATFGHIGLGRSTGFDYSREKNPTRQHLEETITALEGARDTLLRLSVGLEHVDDIIADLEQALEG